MFLAMANTLTLKILKQVLPLDITLCALPDAIYKAYQNVLPKKKRDTVSRIRGRFIRGRKFV